MQVKERKNYFDSSIFRTFVADSICHGSLCIQLFQCSDISSPKRGECGAGAELLSLLRKGSDGERADSLRQLSDTGEKMPRVRREDFSQVFSCGVCGRYFL